MQTIFGIKQKQSQLFLEDGTRVPVTVVSVPETVVTQLKSEEKDGYMAVQVGIGSSKKQRKSLSGVVKKAGLKSSPFALAEVRVGKGEDVSTLSPGTIISVSEVLQPGDIVTATGISKGKGFAGGVKRYGFRGGPKTHGQSDRHRAPGSIGQGTTPGRVYKGKRMAGRMGNVQVTVKNLTVVQVLGSDIYVSGLIPGSKNTLIRLQKIGEKKNFAPVFTVKADEREEVVEAPVEEAQLEESKGTKGTDVKAETKEVVNVEEVPVQTVSEDIATAEETVESPAETTPVEERKADEVHPKDDQPLAEKEEDNVNN